MKSSVRTRMSYLIAAGIIGLLSFIDETLRDGFYDFFLIFAGLFVVAIIATVLFFDGLFWFLHQKFAIPYNYHFVYILSIGSLLFIAAWPVFTDAESPSWLIDIAALTGGALSLAVNHRRPKKAKKTTSAHRRLSLTSLVIGLIIAMPFVVAWVKALIHQNWMPDMFSIALYVSCGIVPLVALHIILTAWSMKRRRHFQALSIWLPAIGYSIAMAYLALPGDVDDSTGWLGLALAMQWFGPCLGLFLTSLFVGVVVPARQSLPPARKSSR